MYKISANSKINLRDLIKEKDNLDEEEDHNVLKKLLTQGKFF